MRSTNPILIVEDDEVDLLTIKRAFGEIKIANELIYAKNGEDALLRLRESKAHPCLILMDINMPIMNGIECVQAIRADEALKNIPVVMLTTSNEEKDRIASYSLGISGYVRKPLKFVDMVETLRTIDLYWTLCEAPV